MVEPLRDRAAIVATVRVATNAIHPRAEPVNSTYTNRRRTTERSGWRAWRVTARDCIGVASPRTDSLILRIPYVWFDRADGGEIAVVMLIGDKTRRGREWYPWAVEQIEGSMIGQWHRRHPNHQAQVRRTR